MQNEKGRGREREIEREKRGEEKGEREENKGRREKRNPTGEYRNGLSRAGRHLAVQYSHAQHLDVNRGLIGLCEI